MSSSLSEQVSKIDSESKLLEYYVSKANQVGPALEVIKSKYVNSDILDRIADDFTDVVVLHEVSKNESCSVELLENLSKHRDMLIRDYALRTLVKKLSDL